MIYHNMYHIIIIEIINSDIQFMYRVIANPNVKPKDITCDIYHEMVGDEKPDLRTEKQSDSATPS